MVSHLGDSAMKKSTVAIVLASILTACGEQPQAASVASKEANQTSIAAPVTAEPTAPSADQGGIKLLAKGLSLPACAKTLEGTTYYVAAEDNFQACSAGAWSIVDLHGKDGKDGQNGKDGQGGLSGKDGQDGVAGVKGERGEQGQTGENGSQGVAGDQGAQGIQGSQGTAGVAGATGAQGAQGVQGVAGAAAQTLRLISGAEFVGDVYSIDKSSGDFWTVNGALRMEISRTAGTFPKAYLVFSGLNCTGTARIVLLNGYFANVYLRGDNSTVVKADGANLGAFNYLSRMPQSTNCQNATGSTTVAWAYSTPTLPFTYPVASPEIEN